MQKHKEFWKRVLKLAGKKDIFFNASAITFNLFICAIPFILILISIIGYVLSIDEAFNEIVRYGREFFPSFTYETQTNDIFRGAITIETFLRPLVGARQLFGIIGIIVLIFFTQGLLHSLKHVLFDVFDIKERKHPVIDVIYNFFGFTLIGTVFIFFSLAISTVSLFNLSQIAIPFTEIVIELPWIYDFLNLLLPIIVAFFVLYVVFRFVSERRIKPKVALMAALTYTVLFEIAKFGISMYLEYAFATYRYFYQGYTILILLGIWTFYTALLFVISAIMARAYKDVFLKKEPSFEENPYTAIS
ncbi:YihY/virulence factor BrkB family protein [Gracilimonas mengyeensis]|uniref:YihY family inner membrane protein n=1 Tax=Gracilimonas mengyeensis TaxID=1302730 RepID=A0A521FA69_9BACT|nr:YihY/virulence factor BrkB family protein [Gracilimonas mengyeensis]SMO92944.1 YihY family inner membrane protein [Gracilimonas mengyeensis]